MTGLEKMKSQILDEAKATADSKIQEAENQAKEILETASQEAAKVADSISQKSAAEIANYKERVESSIDLKKRTEILKAKQEVIAQVLEKAYKAVCEMDTQSYFALLENDCLEYALEKNIQLQQNILTMQETEIDVKKAKAELFPSLSFTTGHNLINRPYQENSNTVSGTEIHLRTIHPSAGS